MSRSRRRALRMQWWWIQMDDECEAVWGILPNRRIDYHRSINPVQRQSFPFYAFLKYIYIQQFNWQGYECPCKFKLQSLPALRIGCGTLSVDLAKFSGTIDNRLPFGDDENTFSCLGFRRLEFSIFPIKSDFLKFKKKKIVKLLGSNPTKYSSSLKNWVYKNRGCIFMSHVVSC